MQTSSIPAVGSSMMRWGRVLVGAVATLLLFSGAYVAFTAVPDAGDLRDSGISWDALVASQPAVADYIQRLLRLAGVAGAGLGLMALVGAAALRSERPWAWGTLWALPLSTTAITAVLAANKSSIGWYYAALTVVGAVGLILARPRKESG